MISKAIVEALQKYVPQENILLQESMAGHTTFRIGGPADCFVKLENEEQLKNVQHYLDLVGVPFFVLGNGSNLLVSDDGYRGVILQVAKDMNRVSVAGDTITAQAGAAMIQVARVAMEQGLTGLEFASGIPGTIGGGVVMNAGAYGGEMSQVVSKVKVLDRNGEILVLDNATMEFGYRTSTIKNNHFTVTEVTFCLQQGDRDAIKARMEELKAKRLEKQPLEFPSAGSTFKRPEGHFAGQLIMEAGLRGFQVGGAKVSEKHCGFVINVGNATAENVHELICRIQEQVQRKFNVELQPEVIFLG